MYKARSKIMECLLIITIIIICGAYYAIFKKLKFKIE